MVLTYPLRVGLLGEQAGIGDSKVGPGSTDGKLHHSIAPQDEFNIATSVSY